MIGDGCGEAFGDGAGRRALRDAVPRSSAATSGSWYRAVSLLQGTVASAFAWCPALADRDAVLVQGPQHQLDRRCPARRRSRWPTIPGPGTGHAAAPGPGACGVPGWFGVGQEPRRSAARSRTVSRVVWCCRAICTRVRPSTTYQWCRSAAGGIAGGSGCGGGGGRPVDVEFSSSHRHPVGRYPVHGADRRVVQAPGHVQLGQGGSVQLQGRGGACGSGRRGIPCRRSAAFTLVVVVPRAAATSRTVPPFSTYSSVSCSAVIGSGGAAVGPARCLRARCNPSPRPTHTWHRSPTRNEQPTRRYATGLSSPYAETLTWSARTPSSEPISRTRSPEFE